MAIAKLTTFADPVLDRQIELITRQMSAVIQIGSYGSLNEAIAARGTTETTLVVNAPTILTANLTVPANITLDVQRPGAIDQGSYTLTINGPFTAPLAQVFTGAGAVTFGAWSIKYAIPQWWGANTAANINKAIAAYPYVMCTGTYDLESQVLLLSYTVLKGYKGSTVFKRPTGVSYTGYDDAFMVGFATHGAANYTARVHVTMEDITVDGNSYNATDSGSLSGVYFHSGEDITIRGCTVKNLGRTAGWGLSSGIVFSWIKNGMVDDCRAYDNTGDGINLYAFNYSCVVTRNRVCHNGVAGIELEGRVGTGYILSRNRSIIISENIVYENCGEPWGSTGTSYGHGILVDFSDDVVIANNTLFGNVVWGGAIMLLGNTNVSVKGNSVYYNLVGDTIDPGAWGICVWAQYDPYEVFEGNGVNRNITISGNTLTGNKNGIFSRDTIGLFIGENTVDRTDALNDGIIIEAGTVGKDASIRSNIVKVHSGSTCIGINGDYNGADVEGNQLLAGLYGVSLYPEDSIKTALRIKDNTFDSVTNGIYGFPSVEIKDGFVVGNIFKNGITDALGGGGGNLILSSTIVKDNHYAAGAINAVWPVGIVPTTGTWRVGDRAINTVPTVGQPKAWVCTVAGTPGTWVSEGNL